MENFAGNFLSVTNRNIDQNLIAPLDIKSATNVWCQAYIRLSDPETHDVSIALDAGVWMHLYCPC